MSAKIKVVLYGVGGMGEELTRLILQKRDLELVAAIGHKTHIGEDIGRVSGLGQDLGIVISNNALEIYRKVKAEVIILANLKYFTDIFAIAKPALEAGLNVISIGEEASYPWIETPDLAQQIDELAKRKGLRFIGTGLNPGFMLDFLPLTLTGIMERTDQITIRRVTNLQHTGLINWHHFGFGMTEQAYNEAKNKGQIGKFLGYKGMMTLTCKALGWGKLDDYRETQTPHFSKSRRVCKFGVIEPGTICGMSQNGYAFVQGKERIVYLISYMMWPTLEEDGMEAGTFISLKGVEGVEVSVKGDQMNNVGKGTASRAVNSIPQLLKARPGLLTIDELPPSPCLP